MGVLLTASCQCGYENDRLLLGGGMLNFMQHSAAPALCAGCDDIMLVDLLDSDGSCPNCGGSAEAYDDPGLRANRRTANGLWIEWNLPDGRRFALDEGAIYRCPRCKRHTMSFRDVGSFD